MSTYIFGDVHGRVRTLDALLEKIEFCDDDHAIFVGDLVNVGPQSAATLRRVRSLRHQTTVLGNHDLHLLAVALAGHAMRSRDTFQDILEAPDRAELVDWLLAQKLAATHQDALIIHAGLLPEWNVETALQVAKEIEAALAADPGAVFKDMYGDEPSRWRDDLDGMDRLRIGINTLTRARALTRDGALEYNFKGEYQNLPAGLRAWFDVCSIPTPVYFGHWSALGFRRFSNFTALDSGCAWGRALTCFRVDDDQGFQQRVVA